MALDLIQLQYNTFYLTISAMKFLLLSLILFAIVCCTPRIFYSGETYPPYQPQEIEVFFDENKIIQPYEVIGTLADSGGSGARHEKIQQAMIDRAKAVGADAIVFHDVDVEHSEAGAFMIRKAKAIRYHYPDIR